MKICVIPDFGPTLREIHKEPCERCPSMQGDDPESKQMRRAYKAGHITAWDLVFKCAWRREKLCHGVCLKAGITEADLAGDEVHKL